MNVNPPDSSKQLCTQSTVEEKKSPPPAADEKTSQAVSPVFSRTEQLEAAYKANGGVGFKVPPGLRMPPPMGRFDAPRWQD